MIDALKFVFLRGPARLDAKATELPRRLKLLNWGRNESTEGVVILDAESVSVFEANQKLIGRSRCPLDFEHNTVPGSEEYNRTTEPRNVAAFGAPKLIPGEGLFLDEIDWKVARDTVANFEDLSAAPILDKNRRVIALHSGALTKAGAVYDLPSFFDQAQLKAMAATLTNHQNPMSELKAENIIFLTEIAPVLGLAANASKADVLGKLGFIATLSAIVTLKDGKPDKFFGAEIKDGKIVSLSAVTDLEARLKKVEEAGTKQIATLSATVDGKVLTFTGEDVVKLAARLDKMDADLKAGITAGETRERNEIVSRFSAEGKAPIDPATGKAFAAEALGKLTLGELKMLHANTPATVPLNARGKVGAEGKTIDPNLKGRDRVVAAMELQNARS